MSATSSTPSARLWAGVHWSRLMLAEEKPKKRKVTIRGDEKISQYLSEDYSDDDIGSAFGGMERFKRREETVKGAVRWVSY